MKKIFLLVFLTLTFLGLLYIRTKERSLPLEAGYRSPQIYIQGGDSPFSAGGLIALASTDEPAVQIGGYNISGQAEVSIYKANLDLLTNYLTHDKDGKQTKAAPDVSTLEFLGTTNHSINTDSYEGSKVSLPLQETGIWYLKVKIGQVNADAFILRSNTGVLAKEGDNEFIFWGQSFKTKRSITEGSVTILNLKDSAVTLSSGVFDSSGIAEAPISKDADIALARFGDDVAIVPLNLKYLNVGTYSSWSEKTRNTNYFVFTDRPLYKPGDTVYFKAILRDDDDARYSIPTGAARTRIYAGYSDQNDPLFDKSLPISQDGTVSGEYVIPEDSKVGNYSLSVNTSAEEVTAWGESHFFNSTIYFDVQYYQKPEFAVDVTTDKMELIAGDKGSFKILGNYFSGQPMSGQKMKYSIYASDFYSYQYANEADTLSDTFLSDARYSFYGSNKIVEGEVELDKNGEKVITFDTKMDFNEGRNQVFSIEATLDDGSQSPSFARRNVLVYAGEFGIFREDSNYGSKINTPLEIPTILKKHIDDAGLGKVELTAKVHREEWIKYQDPKEKFPSYRKEEEDLSDIRAVTDGNGKAKFNFTPNKLGFYRFTVQAKDDRGNLVSNIFYSYVTDQDQPAYVPGGASELTVVADKQKYNPGDTAKLFFYSATQDRDIFVSFERGRMDRFNVVKLNGNKGEISVPVTGTDVPNVYVRASSFSAAALDSSYLNLSVSSLGKRVITTLTFDSKKYGPGDSANVEISTKDGLGNPVSADVALWAVDKAIFELSDNKLGNIFETFWNERGNTTEQDDSLEGIIAYSAEGGGCFLEGTQVLMSGGKTKNIEDIKIGEYVLTRKSEDSQDLVKAKVTDIHSNEEPGYLVINRVLKVTPNHILYVNGEWKEAGNMQPGDILTDSSGNSVTVTSVEWQKAKAKVHNLTVDKYNTYFADGLFVHNQKGSPRSTFRDTAYWNPSIKTDGSGRANVSFKLPDNLTTWTVAAVAVTKDTKVGQTTEEIVVTKDVVVRPILPNIMRIGDEMIISTLVQNSTDEDREFDINLEFDSGKVTSGQFKKATVRSQSIERFGWEIIPEKENEKAKISISASDSSGGGDTVIQEIPVKSFGFYETTASVGDGNKVFDIALPRNIEKEKSSFTLSLSPSILGTLQSAMKYLIGYPYGCTEQITSRLIPALISKASPGSFSELPPRAELDEMIEKGISKLSSSQQSGGGWTWWFSGSSESFVTSYVVEYLVYAKSLGYEVEKSVLDNARGYLGNQKRYDSEKQTEVDYSDSEWAVKNYGLMLLGDTKNMKRVNLDNLSADTLSYAVITNYRLGDKNPATNGLNKLVSMAKEEGDSIYWPEGDRKNFGSKDASTALAIRAITISGGDRNLAVKGARYLVRNRKWDFWSNTYATSQVIRALTDLSDAGDESSPNYSYQVLLNGEGVTSGNVTDIKAPIKEIKIPADKVLDGSKVEVSMNGQGKIYSTFVQKIFNTNRDEKAKGNKMTISREYINEKGEGLTPSVGDSVTVKLTVTGPEIEERYAVITDELPAGMVPINPNFLNEQYGEDPRPVYFSSSDVTGMEVTQNGVVLSLASVGPGTNTYTYRARVVSAGKYFVPPANVSLMYAPEIFAQTKVEKIEISNDSKLEPIAFVKSLLRKYGLIVLGLGLFLALAGTAIVKLKKKGFKFGRKTPPESPPTPPVPPVETPVPPPTPTVL
jgi:uncharacterized protein YfaS (alpha-2-macroglobulin family)